MQEALQAVLHLRPMALRGGVTVTVPFCHSVNGRKRCGEACVCYFCGSAVAKSSAHHLLQPWHSWAHPASAKRYSCIFKGLETERQTLTESHIHLQHTPLCKYLPTQITLDAEESPYFHTTLS